MCMLVDVLPKLKDLNLGWIFDSAGLGIFNVCWYFDLKISSAENTALHSHIVQNSRIVLKPISEIIVNPVLIPTWIHLTGFNEI